MTPRRRRGRLLRRPARPPPASWRSRARSAQGRAPRTRGPARPAWPGPRRPRSLVRPAGRVGRPSRSPAVGVRAATRRSASDRLVALPPEPGHGIGDGRAVEQLVGASEAVGDAHPTEGLGDHRGLGVGAHEHRLADQGRPGRGGRGRAGDGAGLGRLVGVGARPSGTAPSGRSGGAGEPAAVAEHGVGHGQDLRASSGSCRSRRTISAPGKRSAGSSSKRSRYGRRRRSTRRWPGWGRRRRTGRRGRRARPEQAVLQRVDVLELVDEQVAEAPALGGGEAWRRARQSRAAQRASRSSKSTSPRPRSSASRSGRAGGGHLVAGQRRPPARAGGVGPGSRRGDEPGLGPLDLGDDVDGPTSRLAPPRRRRHEPDLAVEQPGRVGAAVGPPGGAGRRRWRGTCRRRRRRAGRGAAGGRRSSPAALRVKVRASTWRGSSVAGRPARWAMRRVSTRVLPEPAPARMHRGPAGLVDGRPLGLVEAPEQLVALSSVDPPERTDRAGRDAVGSGRRAT